MRILTTEPRGWPSCTRYLPMYVVCLLPAAGVRHRKRMNGLSESGMSVRPRGTRYPVVARTPALARKSRPSECMHNGRSFEIEMAARREMTDVWSMRLLLSLHERAEI